MAVRFSMGEQYRASRESFWRETSSLFANFPSPRQHAASAGKYRLFHLWARMVEDYSSRDSTNSEDKLLAISAVAQEFAHVFGTGYCAGLWHSILVPQLLWKSVYGSRKPNNRADTYRSPSWSWASIVGRVDLCSFLCSSDSKLNVLDCEVALANNNTLFSAVASDILTVQGALRMHQYIPAQFMILSPERFCACGT